MKVNFQRIFINRKTEAHASVLSQRGWDSNPRYSYPYTNFPGLLLQPLGHLSILFEAAKNNKKFQLRKLNPFFYDNSPRNEVSKIVLKTAGATFCPKRYINLVTAASVVLSLPEITPIFFNCELVSYCPMLTLPPEH